MRKINAVMHHKGHPSRRVMWDVEYREQEPNGRPMLGEEKLYANILIKAIQDAKGVSKDAQDECLECHRERHPECFLHTTRLGEEWFVKTNRRCEDFHTFQQCALAWIASDEPGERSFVDLCDTLSLEPTYVRRCLNRKECEAYWQDEGRINCFLEYVGAHSQTFGNVGCADPEGETDDPS